MDRVVLLTEIRAALSSVPDFMRFTPMSETHLRWLGKVGALVNQWSAVEMVAFRNAELMLSGHATRPIHVGRILGLLHRAEADLSAGVSGTPQQVFGPGAVYDFFKALRDVISGASTDVLIVDPYLDESVFDAYVSAVRSGVAIRLLAHRYGGSLKSAAQLYRVQSNQPIEMRLSNQLHDRLVVIDGGACWVLGQSIKDAARKGPTYLAPLSEDAAQLKVSAYATIWQSAQPF